jgi:hypothetical protein
MVFNFKSFGVVVFFREKFFGRCGFDSFQLKIFLNLFFKDISVITEVIEMKPCPNPCSWTSAYVPYYLHTINRTKVFLKFFY